MRGAEPIGVKLTRESSSEPEPDIVTVIAILIVGDELIAKALDQLLRIVAMQISMMIKSISARTQKARQR